MKILFPCSSFRESAKSFDQYLIFSQWNATYSALATLVKHPEEKEAWMDEWSGHVKALASYCLEISKEILHRDLPHPGHDHLLELINTSGVDFENTHSEKMRYPSLCLDPNYHQESRALILKDVGFEYVRANAALKSHDQLGLTRQEAERALQRAKESYFWYDRLGWRKEEVTESV